jgi:hypothetical protein
LVGNVSHGLLRRMLLLVAEIHGLAWASEVSIKGSSVITKWSSISCMLHSCVQYRTARSVRVNPTSIESWQVVVLRHRDCLHSCYGSRADIGVDCRDCIHSRYDSRCDAGVECCNSMHSCRNSMRSCCNSRSASGVDRRERLDLVSEVGAES